MSLAWTTILIIALLLPGATFLLGLSTKDRFSREILKSGALGELALALLIAAATHVIVYGAVSLLLEAEQIGATLRNLLRAIEDPYGHAHEIERAVFIFTLYTLGAALVLWLAGWRLAAAIKRGTLPRLALHPWTNELIPSNDSVITAYVMTKTTTNDQILMYKGILNDFYLNENGNFSYIVLRNCARYAMSVRSDSMEISPRLALLKEEDPLSRKWNYLTIEGANIANVLFDRNEPINDTPDGERALEAALEAANAQTGPTSMKSGAD
ncbi:hypothetical protein ACLBXM_08515 [Xanthobacteraceae bacterium A53D]